MTALPIPLRTGRADLRHYQMGGGLVEGREFMNIYGPEIDGAPSEIVAVTYGDACQERAAEIVTATNEYDALKAVDAAARSVSISLDSFMATDSQAAWNTFLSAMGVLDASLLTLDAIRKGA